MIKYDIEELFPTPLIKVKVEENTEQLKFINDYTTSSVDKNGQTLGNMRVLEQHPNIRDLLLSHDYQVNPLAEALLFCAQRSQLIEEVVLPSLNNGVVVLSDRSAYSSVAYQGEGRGLGYEKIYQLNDISIQSNWPERVVLLDIDPEVSLSRQQVADRIGSDKVEFFQKVRKGYLKLAEEFKDSFLILNAENNIQVNIEAICNWLEIDNSK